MATILVGAYDDMQKRLQTTGSSNDVNVIALHYKAEGSAVAYRLLADTDSSHPPGQCCPNGEATCCGVEEIPLSAIGIDGTLSASAVKKFYQYLVKQYPAEHYLMGLRGIPDTTRVLGGEFTRGITIVELGDALKTVIGARGGKKVDVLTVGFCESGALDWAYGVSPYVDYYVGSPQYTNSPVARPSRSAPPSSSPLPPGRRRPSTGPAARAATVRRPRRATAVTITAGRSPARFRRRRSPPESRWP